MDSVERPKERSVLVDGLRIRYLEAGSGPAALLLHGGSLGSSADVFRRNMAPLAAAGFRALAFDQPGFGLSDVPKDHSASYRRKSILMFMDALGLKEAALIGHSQAGQPVVQIAFSSPQRVTHALVLGTGSLLPPAEGGAGAPDGEAQRRLERRMAQAEPTLDDTRKLLEANLFHHELITQEELELRHSRSVGRAFEAFCARSAAPRQDAKANGEPPIWTRLAELPTPLLLIYGRQDRAKAYERACALKQAYPILDLHIVEGCKHMIPWDAADAFLQLTIPFLKQRSSGLGAISA